MVVAGVIAHIPMFVGAADMNFRLAGMQMSLLMTIGMYGIIIGTAVVAYGLMPGWLFRPGKQIHIDAANVHVQALDNAELTPTHWKLFAVLVVALIVDVMKPATLGFVIPGTAAEYGLTKQQVALLPMAGILGTTMGSFLWGWLGDTIGRRASILLAAIIFIGTSICGAMPSYNWNVFMCWLMGLGAGGMLPITFALLAEIVPRKQRGWLIVLLGAIGTIGGYLAASGFAALLEPYFGWRIMWFLGLPTGVILILLNRYIPESPRFLLAKGNREEAFRVMESFGIEIVKDAEATSATDTAMPVADVRGGNLVDMFRQPYTGLTMGLGLYGMAWGLVNFGFLLWLPLNLREIGMSVGSSDAILAKSAIIAFPATLVGAWLYHSWSTKNTLILFALLSVATLCGFAAVGDQLIHQPVLMSFLLVALLASSSGVIAMLSPYTAEVFPVHIRATASGWSAGCSKGAGVATLGAAAVIGLTPGMAAAAILAAVPTLFACAAVAWKGIETRGMGLEMIQAMSVRQTNPE
ncbi:Niacin transporter NiaP [hydrothermal vent metagenome]|uniref:Niacin transporter NiaP n=1 Tax=hydrothermal vent metagenome TaxID=652676 RepID=A0A3B0YF26_9ZZZZ